MTIHTVLPGESVFSIAQMYKVPMERIISDNELATPSRLTVGQTLVLRYPKQYHIVEAGDTLSAIAAMHGITVSELYQLNPNLNGLPLIVPGQSIVVSLAQPKQGTLATNGYAYPSIDRAVLRKTLPLLTYLSIFAYRFDAQGNLLPVDDADLIALARDYGAKPLLTLATLGEDGMFSADGAHALLQSEAAQANIIEQLARTMAQKDYAGVDFDFAYLSPEDSDAYAAFVRCATARLNGLGFETFAALAPTVSPVQPKIFGDACDAAALAGAANNARLLPYEWACAPAAPGAVAPLGEVRETVQCAAQAHDPRSLFLGIPNYGYEWALPPAPEPRTVHPLGNVAATEQAIAHNAAIAFDRAAQSPHYEDWRGRIHHAVWFEDARSVQAKLALAVASGLRGVSVWQLAQWFPQLWLVLSSLYHIEKDM